MRKYLGMPASEWFSLSWDLQQTYLDGLAQDSEVPFHMVERGGEPPVTRRNADMGGAVVDLKAMREELEMLRGQQTAAG